MVLCGIQEKQIMLYHAAYFHCCTQENTLEVANEERNYGNSIILFVEDQT
jgi:hypothetical protein